MGIIRTHFFALTVVRLGHRFLLVEERDRSGWYLPGGRVEPGETEAEAVVRECREELGTSVVPGRRLGTDLPIRAGVLRVHTAVPAAGAEDPRALEHSALRWVTAPELGTVGWLDADRAVVHDLAGLLGGSGDGGSPGGPEGS